MTTPKIPPLKDTAPAIAKAIDNAALGRWFGSGLFATLFKRRLPSRQEAVRQARRLRIGKIIPYIRGDKK